MSDRSSSIAGRIQDVGNQVGQAAENAAATVSSMADGVSHRAKEWVADATKRAENVGAYLSERANEATTAAGGRIRAAGEAIEGASRAASHSIENAGGYLEKEGLNGIANDVVTIMKRNPIPTMLVGVGLGFLLARGISRHA